MAVGWSVCPLLFIACCLVAVDCKSETRSLRTASLAHFQWSYSKSVWVALPELELCDSGYMTVVNTGLRKQTFSHISRAWAHKEWFLAWISVCAAFQGWLSGMVCSRNSTWLSPLLLWLLFFFYFCLSFLFFFIYLIELRSCYVAQASLELLFPNSLHGSAFRVAGIIGT